MNATNPVYDPITTSIITTVTSTLSLLALVLLTYLQKRLGVHVQHSHSKIDQLHDTLKIMSASGSQNDDPENRI